MNSPVGLAIEPDYWEVVARALTQHLAGIEVWAFGSRVTGKHRRFSDLDLAVVSDEPLSFRVRGALEEEFEESLLPFKVDVVELATVSEGFRTLVSRHHVVLQEARPAYGQ